jgi:hypothetical protein
LKILSNSIYIEKSKRHFLYLLCGINMKKFIVVCLFVIYALPLLGFAQNDSRGKYWDDPIKILDTVVWEANDDYKIQQTALDNATDKQWWYASSYKISNTLDWLRQNINPYLQRAVYIGLSLAVILLIYNGFLMVTNAVHKEWEAAKIKKNIMNIVIWVIILTWFYFIIKLMVALINAIFGGYGGDTWF